MMEGVQHNQHATCSWLIILGNGAILKPQRWSLPLTDWALSGGCSQVGLSGWMSTLLNPCVTSIPDTMAALFMNSPGTTEMATERDCLASTEQVFLSYY